MAQALTRLANAGLEVQITKHEDNYLVAVLTSDGYHIDEAERPYLYHALDDLFARGVWHDYEKGVDHD